MAVVMIVIAFIVVTSIAGWAAVATAQALSGNRRGDADIARQLEAMAQELGALRDDVDAMADRYETDREALEERLDFAERMLTRGKESSDT